ncbi:nmrA-like family protein [Annulohypoxylon maeteangense]|uniref:nmrA-like family protein n=1 Tax=Annulohypoxylon maeteangense TaxID=1927788 RepID=UPI002008BB0F|nr:nmrA-like family protein [Annulohypoxylon maeteangense]KAI0888438.1 nmrA-like family protein [Annulohypoxylon maeteangense]
MSITVGIAGITGRFARELTSILLKNPNVTIKGYCRDPSKVPQSFSNVSLVKGDAYDEPAIQSFVTGCDVVVCCYLGDPKLMVEGQKLLIDACAAQGVPRYVASDWCVDYTKLKLGQLFPKDPMIHIKAYLDAQDKVKGVHILVGMFTNGFFGAHFGIYDAVTTTFKYWGTGNEIWEGTTYRNAAEYTAAVCLDKDAVGILKLVGGRSTIHEIATSFERVYGVKPNVECQGSLDDLFKLMNEQREKDPKDLFSYMFLLFHYYMINGTTEIGPQYDNDKYPQVKPVTWEDYLRNVSQDQLPNAMSVVGQNV